jgi:CBS domain containing-hemolysin-like protein
MDVLYSNLSLEENMKIITETRHSRYPVAFEDKDRIIGFIHITDLLFAPPEQQNDLTTLVRPILNVPESMEISHTLRFMQKNKAQLTLVVDEYGGTAGLLTAEEILEEIVGDLHDEFEDERPSVERNGDYISVEGRMLIEDVNDLTGVVIEDDEVDSIGGWLFKELEGNPSKGKRVKVEDVVFEVEESTRLRITRINIHHEPRVEDGETSSEQDKDQE